ncbi:glycoside hydrolase [uncultured Mediterranean phage uvDeep-CGR2-KM21-C88]|nr:glycoside hydrolase [uncultured Mediterranean phage uvDeep-CGR2-KM21-C88]
MATAAELARRNAAAMEGFRSSLRSAREGAETRAAFHAAELADRRREKQAEADRRAQKINTIVGMLGGLAQTGISSWAQSERQKAADIAAGERQKESDAARAASALAVQDAADAARLNREKLDRQWKGAQEYIADLHRRYPAGGPEAEVVAEPQFDLGTPALIRTPENRGSILDPESNSRGSSPLFKDTGERDDEGYPIYTENYDTFFEEGDNREDPDAIATAHENWRDALQDRTKETFWAIWHDKGVSGDANLLDPDGEPPPDETVAKWNRLYREGNYEGMEAMVGGNRSFIAFHNFVYGPPVDEPTPAADPGPRTMGESLSRDAGTPSVAAGGTPIVTGEGAPTDVWATALVNNPLFRTLSGLPPEEKDNIPATERSDRAKGALALAEQEGNLTGEESGLVPQLIRFADQLEELESLNELQAAKGEEPQHDLAQYWFELEKWIQEIEQPGDEFENVDNWWMHQRGAGRLWPRERSGEVKADAIATQLAARISDLSVLVPGSAEQRAQQAQHRALFSGTGRGG